MITFTVVTITYNAAAVLQPTLDSVLMQSHEHVEHIIVDGASQDNTLKLAEAYKQKSDAEDNGHEVLIQSEPDRGLYDAMNKGLQRATGDYIVFLNAGDRFPAADTLELVAQAAEVGDAEETPAVLYGDTEIIDTAGHTLGLREKRPPVTLTWRSFMKGMVVCHQAFYARTDIARALPYNIRYKYSADVDWCIRVMREAARRGLELKQVPEVIVQYVREGQSTIHHRASLRERFRVMVRHYGLLPTLAMHVWFVVGQIVKKFKAMLSA